MNTYRKIMTGLTGIFLTLFLTFALHPVKATAQPGTAVNYQVFYNSLAPYGQWLNDPQYGYVWAPNVGRDFRPYYTNGHWAMTEYGNMWVSNYSWGWAPFHYGRWVLSSYYGWIWIPGNEWGPAWVSWRQGNGYYGWAPLGPGVTINISFGNNFYMPDPYWTFIPSRYIYSRSFHRYYSPRRTRTIINHTTIINNTYIDRSRNNTYIAGPRRADVQRATGRTVPVYQVAPRREAGSSRINGRTVDVYRPRVDGNNHNRQLAPRNVKAISHPIAAPSRRQPTPERNTRQSTVRPEPDQRVPAQRTPQRATPQRTTPRSTQPNRQQPEREPVRRATPVKPSRQSTQRQPAQRREVTPRSTESRRSTEHRSVRQSSRQNVSTPRQSSRSSRSATPAAPRQTTTHRR